MTRAQNPRKKLKKKHQPSSISSHTTNPVFPHTVCMQTHYGEVSIVTLECRTMLLTLVVSQFLISLNFSFICLSTINQSYAPWSPFYGGKKTPFPFTLHTTTKNYGHILNHRINLRFSPFLAAQQSKRINFLSKKIERRIQMEKLQQGQENGR